MSHNVTKAYGIVIVCKADKAALLFLLSKEMAKEKRVKSPLFLLGELCCITDARIAVSVLHAEKSVGVVLKENTGRPKERGGYIIRRDGRGCSIP